MNCDARAWARASLCTLVLACTACKQDDMQQTNEKAGAENKSQAATQGDTRQMQADMSVDEQVRGAKIDLASHLGVDADAISVKEARAVQWSSGALGCPKPGMDYTQALVPGLRVLLEVDGVIYYYHGSKGRSLFNCPVELAKAPAFGPGEEVM